MRVRSVGRETVAVAMLWEHHTAGVDLCSLLVPGNTARPDASQTIETMAWFTQRAGATAFAYLVHKAMRRADTVLPRRGAVAFRYAHSYEPESGIIQGGVTNSVSY